MLNYQRVNHGIEWAFHPNIVRQNPKSELVGGMFLALWKMMEWVTVAMMILPNWMENESSYVP